MIYDQPGITYDGQVTDGSFVQMAQRLQEVWGRLGLDSSSPLIQNATNISFGTVSMGIVEAADTVTVTRS